MRVDPAAAGRVVEHGPSAEDANAGAAFRAFWGDKAELRHFPVSVPALLCPVPVFKPPRKPPRAPSLFLRAARMLAQVMQLKGARQPPMPLPRTTQPTGCTLPSTLLDTVLTDENAASYIFGW